MTVAPEISSPVAGEHSAVLAWIFRQRGVLANLPLLFALFWTRGEVNNSPLTWSIGLALLLLGMAVRIWAQSHIHHRLVKTTQFTCTGPYQIIRNPLYIGNTLLILAGTFFSKLVWLAPVSLVWCAFVYSLVVRNEEGHLAALYEEPYREYLRTVPRWFPKPGTLHNPDFVNEHTGRAVVAELHCLLVIVPFLIKDMIVNPAWHGLWGGPRT